MIVSRVITRLYILRWWKRDKTL